MRWRWWCLKCYLNYIKNSFCSLSKQIQHQSTHQTMQKIAVFNAWMNCDKIKKHFKWAIFWCIRKWNLLKDPFTNHNEKNWSNSELFVRVFSYRNLWRTHETEREIFPLHFMYEKCFCSEHQKNAKFYSLKHFQNLILLPWHISSNKY